MTKDNKGQRAFIWWAWFMVLTVAMDLFVNLGDWTELFWFCPVIGALTAWSLFRRNARWLTVALVLAVPAQSPWVFDFILDLLGLGMGRTAMLRECGPFIFWGSLVIHTVVIPILFWAVARVGFHVRALWSAIWFGAVLLTLTFIFTPPFKNVNCVFYGCDAADPGRGYLAYFFGRSLLIWAVVVPLSFLIFKRIYRHNLVGGEKNADSA